MGPHQTAIASFREACGGDLIDVSNLKRKVSVCSVASDHPWQLIKM